MAQNQTPGRNFNWRRTAVVSAVAAVGIAAAVATVSAVSASPTLNSLVAAATSTKASCTQNPAVVLTPAAQPTAAKITEVCTIPLLAAQTVTVTASPSDSASPTSPTSSTPPSNTGSAPSTSPTPTGSTSTPPVPASFPDSASTGPTGALRVLAGNQTIPANTTLTGVDIAGTVTLGKNANLTNSRVRGNGTDSSDFLVLAQDGDLISNVEIGGGADGKTYSAAIGVDVPPGATVNLTAVDIHHTSDAIRWDGGLNLAASYIHDLVIDQLAGVHSDGAQATNSANKLPSAITGNNITGGTNDDIFGQQYAGPVAVTGNLFQADQTRGNQTSYGVAIYTASSAIVTGNTFTHGFQVAPIMVASGIKSTISGNVYEDGTPVA